MNTLAFNLKRLLEEKNLPEATLAKIVEVSQPVINRTVTGKTEPRITTVNKIAKYLNVSVDSLINESDFDRLSSESKRTTLTVPLIANKDVQRWAKEAASIKPQKEMFTDFDHTCENLFAVTLEDTTMLPQFPKGCILIVNPNIPAKDEDFVVAYKKGDANILFKRLFIDGNRKYLKSLNGDFPMFEMTSEYTIAGPMIRARIDV